MNRRLCNERREFMKLHPSVTIYCVAEADTADVIVDEQGIWQVDCQLPDRLHKLPRKSEWEYED